MGTRPACARRPALVAAAACGVGAVLADAVALPVAPVGVLVAASVAAAAAWRRARPWLLLVGVAAAAALRYECCTELLPRHHIARAPLADAPVRVRGQVRGEPVVADDHVQFELELAAACGAAQCGPACGRLRVLAPHGSLDVGWGDRLDLVGRLTAAPAARNPDAFDYRGHLARLGIHGVFRLHGPEGVIARHAGPGPACYEYVIRPVRSAARGVIRTYLEGDSAGLLEGLLLGDQQAVSVATRGAFRVTGLTHALVVSGMNVGLVAGLVFFGLTVCGCPERPAVAVTLAVLAAFAAVTGMEAPVVRATAMAAVVLTGRVLGRQADMHNSLGLAALLVFAVWPQSVLGVSFQLSFVATWAIVALYRPLWELLPASWRGTGSWRSRFLVAPLCLSLAAQLGTAPLLAYYFQQLPPIAPLANLVVLPLATVALQLGLAGVAVGVVWEPAALPFAACNGLVLAAMLAAVKTFAALPGAGFAVPRPSPTFMAWSAVELGLVAGSLAGPRVWRLACVGLLFWAGSAVWGHLLRPRTLEAVALDVGQGDAALLRFPNGRTVLIDGGDATARLDYGERVLVPFLHSRGIRHLDAVVGTHPHSDHIGGLPAVLDAVDVGWYFDNGREGQSRPAQQLRQLVTSHGIAYRALAGGDSLAGFGDGGILVLWPPPAVAGGREGALRNANEASVVLRVTSGRSALLFAGDIEAGSEQALLAWTDRLRAQVLKVPHHGAPTSSSPRFVRAVDPRLAVVSVGAGNRFGHPAERVMALLRGEGALTVRTDLAGAVMLVVGPDGLTARTMLPFPGLPCRWPGPQ